MRENTRQLTYAALAMVVVASLGCAEMNKNLQRQLEPFRKKKSPAKTDAKKDGPTKAQQKARANAAKAAKTEKALPVPAGEATFRPVAGVRLERLTRTGEDERWPTLSSWNGELLVTRSVKSGKNQTPRLAGLDPRTGTFRMFYTEPGVYASQGRWAAGGQQLVFVSDALGPMGLVRTPAKKPPTAITRIVDEHLARGLADPAPSPDNTRVAFTTNIRNAKYVAVSKLDGSDYTIIARGGAPSWDPTSKRLAFHREVDGYYQLFVVDARTGTNIEQLTTAKHDHVRPTWSPDGSSLAFVFAADPQKGSTALRTIRVLDRAQRTLTEGTSDLTAPQWSRTGWIYFQATVSGQSEIFRLAPGATTAPPAPRAVPKPNNTAPANPTPPNNTTPDNTAPSTNRPAEPNPIISL